MYFICGLILIILFFILLLLGKEEKIFKKKITHGLASKFWVLKERREYVRFDEEMKIRYNTIEKPRDLLSSKTVNISKKGLCLVAYEKLEKKSYLTIEMEVPGFSKPVKSIGEVMWTKDLQMQDEKGRRLFYIGIKFSKISPGSEAILLTHLKGKKSG